MAFSLRKIHCQPALNFAIIARTWVEFGSLGLAMCRLMITCFMVFLMPVSKNAFCWEPPISGIEYEKFNFSGDSSHVHAFRIDPQHYHFDLVVKNRLDHFPTKQAFLPENALIAVNGGFFSPNLQPLGLRIHNGKTLSSYKAISWWGIFFIEDDVPQIIASNAFRPNKKIRFAIQSGPRLIVDSNILPLKPGIANRSALCIDKEKNIIIAVTEFYPLTLTGWAQILKNHLGCQFALNLDGGHSTQLAAKIGDFVLNIGGFTPVSDVISVIRKNSGKL